MDEKTLRVALGEAPLSNLTEPELPMAAGTFVEVRLDDDRWYTGVVTMGGTEFEVRPHRKRWPNGQMTVTRSVNDISNWRAPT